MKISARVSKPVRDHLVSTGLGNLSAGIETVTEADMKRMGKKTK